VKTRKSLSGHLGCGLQWRHIKIMSGSMQDDCEGMSDVFSEKPKLVRFLPLMGIDLSIELLLL
jgi:hypothetical protein